MKFSGLVGSDWQEASGVEVREPSGQVLLRNTIGQYDFYDRTLDPWDPSLGERICTRSRPASRLSKQHILGQPQMHEISSDVPGDVRE
ncbi:hypothetical protein SNOG_01996 [Parastagonospora nodorum SN15]|uniref:Uncharacterized protein n=1 Tax=Phaeosphaeria nodorum (strain SN15 / ATCC MYA-4574 / FGSC 10173) TaxID=321614 RepID=Q0V1W8_PHANO|nr:hypothetical protein SNOG_01996 [Parastagonospora nodorum SN15]EAT90208.1 hypothetical protein SNOG_01996 [Parastagonospora nodorum SN15]